ncbi:DUF4384 domain-containing protein [Desulfobacula toluolica]|uniref:DUF4384 domain-containing protein n=1 Tax=Desulfobacula toluolica (strain DSM 7467 / Tol2) TaxID=651182 RepID=K0NHD3_DESTT|nr:DUF4384 domain-containing protein [Desulfobacula toluolica]CCK80686.1 uncharacterized protein TOL2_C25270 [Desulfobacula toluolica Tol2]
MKTKCLFLLSVLAVLIAFSGCKEYVHVGRNWDALHKIKAPEDSFQVKVTGTEKAGLGDSLNFNITSAQSGRLWVVQVDPADTLNVLFPNDAQKENAITADTPLTIPPKGADWEIAAGEPVGESLVAFIVTTGDTDLSDVLNRDKSMSKAIRIVAASPSWGMTRRIIDIQK